MLWVALTIVGSIAVGVEAERRKGPAAGRAARGVLWLMLYVLMPPVVFFNIARLEITANVGAGIALAWVALMSAALIAWGVGRHVLRLERPSAGVLSIVAMQGNTGILGLPFVAAVLGFDRLPEAVAYDSLVQAPVFLLLSFAVAAATGTRAGEGPRQRVKAFFLRNPPLAAVALALVAPDALAPDVLVDASRVLVLAMVPLGFFAVGVTMAEEAEEGALRFPPPFTRTIAAAIVLRLAVAPLVLLALAAPLIDLPGVFVLQAAMPAGLHIVMLAHAYGLDLPFAAGAIVWTTTVWMAFAIAVVIIV